jgi:hypothetical protein
VTETLLWITMDEPKIGRIINVDGVRYRIVGGTWTGTVAHLQVERVAPCDPQLKEVKNA